jgi:hypothetical protein
MTMQRIAGSGSFDLTKDHLVNIWQEPTRAAATPPG